MVTITVKELAQEARRLAQQQPDRTAKCAYVHYVDGELRANCIVGQAAYNLGISLETLEAKNACSIAPLAGFGWAGDYDEDRAEWLDTSAEDSKVHVDWLRTLQGAQDMGSTWREALHAADRFLVRQQFDI